MPLSIAEYLGQRTDNDTQDIIPVEFGGSITPTCPFSGVACRKLNIRNHPVCSVRTQNGQPFIVCPDRLIPAKAAALSPAHIAALAAVAQVLFPTADTSDIGYRRQVSISFAQGRRLVLDYVLQISPDAVYEGGRRKVILEVQGGGETSTTGVITAHVSAWASMKKPANQFLAKPLDLRYSRELMNNPKYSSPGIIPNNAWKRQLDQVLRKADLAKHFGGGFALVMGEVLYDYVKSTIPTNHDYFPEWEIALIGVGETPSQNSGSILFNRLTKVAFMTYAEFLEALQNFSFPDNVVNPFNGEFTTLRNRRFNAS